MIVSVRQWQPVRVPLLAIRKWQRSLRRPAEDRPASEGVLSAWQTLLERNANNVIRALED